MKDKKKKCQFFEEIFLLAKLSINVFLNILFHILINIKLNFLKFKIFKRIYTPKEFSLIIKQVILIIEKNFKVVVLNLVKKTYVIYMSSFTIFYLQIYFSRQTFLGP